MTIYSRRFIHSQISETFRAAKEGLFPPLHDTTMATPPKGDKALRQFEEDVDKGFVYYHSGSPTHMARYLSNFWDVKEHTGKGIRVGVDEYRTVEHAFQGLKFQHLEGQQRGDLTKLFTVDGVIGKKDAGAAKTAGGKGKASLFAKHKVKLDGGKWDENCKRIMGGIVRARSDVDATFQQILRKARKEGIALLHFERNRSGDISKHKWGGSFPGGVKPNERRLGDFRGLNLMGKMLDAEGERLENSRCTQTPPNSGVIQE